MLSDCCLLLDPIFENREFIQVTDMFPYTAGFEFISLYSISNPSQCLLIKQKLEEIINYLSDRYIVDNLSYLVIKNEYKSIIKSELNNSHVIS
jgi:hypothetical protein